jgi:hypothetical protein
MVLLEHADSKPVPKTLPIGGAMRYRAVPG